MPNSAKTAVTYICSKFDVGITRLSRLRRMEARDAGARDMELLLQMPTDAGGEAFKLLGKSQSQLRQDIFAISELGFKRDGYFVEFGATDGFYLSNSYLMEKEFGWRGILAEPAIRWHDALRQNRSCSIETDCVWRDSGSTLTFHEVDEGEFSTVGEFKDADGNRHRRQHGTSYDVKTISFNDLLDKYDAPRRVDYLSIDTEGSEFDILSSFDFSRRQFGVITVEHNFSPAREKIYQLLTSKGYTRKLETLSMWDDWYVLPAQESSLPDA